MLYFDLSPSHVIMDLHLYIISSLSVISINSFLFSFNSEIPTSSICYGSSLISKSLIALFSSSSSSFFPQHYQICLLPFNYSLSQSFYFFDKVIHCIYRIYWHLPTFLYSFFYSLFPHPHFFKPKWPFFFFSLDHFFLY